MMKKVLIVDDDITNLYMLETLSYPRSLML
jgi:hypothetical protein